MQVRVIGGGPAGSAAAIHLRQAGHKVTLYETAAFPRAKLCGGFISGEAFPELTKLGVADTFERCGAWPIRRLVISASSGAEADVPLSHMAWGISRRTLDAMLLDLARSQGAVIHQADGFKATEAAEWIVVAAGRSITKKSGSLCGIQTTLDDVRGLTDQVELNLFPGGYIGLNRHEDGSANLCALLDPKMVRQEGPDLDAVLRFLVKHHAGLAERLACARRRQPWLAVGAVDMGERTLTKKDTFFIGDAACVVDPFAGEGLTMSFMTARLMAESLTTNSETAAAAYESKWHRTFDTPLRMQSILRCLTRSKILQEGFVRGTHFFPALLEWLTEKTRAPLGASQ